MYKFLTLIKFIRPLNAVMAGIAVYVGIYVGHSDTAMAEILMLVATAVCAVGFGNVINDICDIETDRISHPDRPLPKGDISIHGAVLFCSVLGLLAVVLSLNVSVSHGAGVLIPAVLLVLYAVFLKGVPLAGNMIVSFLVAYPILFGAFGGMFFVHLLFPVCASR